MGSGSDWKRATTGLVEGLLKDTLAAANSGEMVAGLLVAAITANRGLVPGLACCIGPQRCTRMHVLDDNMNPLYMLLPSSGRGLLMISITLSCLMADLLGLLAHNRKSGTLHVKRVVSTTMNVAAQECGRC